MNEEAIRAKAREIVQHELDHYYVSPRPETQIDTRFDLREAIAAALHEAVESGLATAQAELAKVKTENEVMAKNLARSDRCYAENFDTLGKVQAELAALRAKWEALAGVLRWVSENTSDENTSQYIRAMTITLTDSTHALEEE